MSLLLCIVEIVTINPQAFLYYVQAVAYALAFWATRCERHTPCLVYLTSCLVHVALGVLHHLSHG